MVDGDLEAAVREAQELEQRVDAEGIETAFQALETNLQRFEESGYPIDSIVPAGENQGLGFLLRGTDSKRFFEVYSNLLRSKLCNEDGEFRRLVADHMKVGVGSILTLVVAAVGAPPAALGILVPIAVIIAQTGLEAFCALQEE